MNAGSISLHIVPAFGVRESVQRVLIRLDAYRVRMEVVTTDTIAGEEIEETLGIARGNTVEARNIGRDVTQALRNVTGGELKAYSELLTKARDEALARMEEEAESMGADAIVNVRLETSTVVKGGAEVIAYGTAVTLKQ